MSCQKYEYQFDPEIPPTEYEQTFCLALMAVESLHGEATVRMDCKFKIDKKNKVITIDPSTDAGHALAKIFTGLCEREFGIHGVSITRIDTENQNRSKDQKEERAVA